MGTQTVDRLAELYQNYLDLGGDLLMLGGLAQEKEASVPDECVHICLRRLTDYIDQHMREIAVLSKALAREAAPPYFPRMAEK